MKYICEGNVCRPIIILEQSPAQENAIPKVVSIYDQYNIVEAEVVLQTLDQKPNGNNRIYDKGSYIKAIEDIRYLIESKRLLGELDHPIKYIDNPMRLFSVLYDDASHVITDVWVDGDVVYGKIRTLPTEKGFKLKNLILDKHVNVGFSLRADADEIPRGGCIYTKVKRIITWDAVVIPSHFETKVIDYVALLESAIPHKNFRKLLMENAELSEYLKKRILDSYYNRLKSIYE